jgi:hypothetical protein
LSNIALPIDPLVDPLPINSSRLPADRDKDGISGLYKEAAACLLQRLQNKQTNSSHPRTCTFKVSSQTELTDITPSFMKSEQLQNIVATLIHQVPSTDTPL